MTVKDLCKTISPLQNIQIGDSKTGEPLTYVTYLADSSCEVWDYGDSEVYGIAPKVDKDGKPYLAILIEWKM